MADNLNVFDPFPEMPPPASRVDSKEDYAAKADATNAAQYKLVKKLNEFVNWLNSLIPDITSARSNAAAAAASAKAAQDAQAATEAAAGNPSRLALLQAIALSF
ncbi:hypothetical protein [Pseudomonas oryzihabitans]|uniref:hypothetical protein n=1 Tax=Pseudomonas oryzihabitans TaxID=47885 RepID=UPI0028999852|nr:hypothetical protein [Pseudomonas oryzihabitans]